MLPFVSESSCDFPPDSSTIDFLYWNCNFVILQTDKSICLVVSWITLIYADGAENAHEVVRKFLSDELEMENAANIEFLRAHRIGKKETGETRPVIVGFLRFPERELVLRRVRELADDIDIKVYADFPTQISERRKILNKVREERKIAFFSKP